MAQSVGRSRWLVATLVAIAVLFSQQLAGARAATSAFTEDAAVQPDSEPVVGGFVNSGSGGIGLARYGTSGDLDQSFAFNGRSVVADALANSPFGGIDIQRDGKIVTATLAVGGGIRLHRFLSSGVADSGFGSGGALTVPGSAIAPGVTFTAVRAVHALRSGKLLVAGGCQCGTASQPVVIRLLPSGQVDSTFGSAGSIVVPYPDSSTTREGEFTAITVDAAGDIYLTGGAKFHGSDGPVVLARLTPGGVLDTSFGSGGVTVTDFPTPAGDPVDKAEGLGISLRPGGGAVIAADNWYAHSTNNTVVEQAQLLAAYSRTGQLDPSFGGSGYVRLADSGAPTASCPLSGFATDSVAVRSSGEVVTFGSSLCAATGNFALATFSATGQLQAVNGGIASTQGIESAATATDPSGRVLGAGTSTVSGSETDFFVARFGSNGMLDTSFCGTGFNTTSFDDLSMLGSNCGVGPQPPTGTGGAGNVGGGGSGDPPAVVDDPNNGGCAASKQSPIDPNDAPQWTQEAANATAGQFTVDRLIDLLNDSPHLGLFLQAYKYGTGINGIVHWFTQTKELVARWQDLPCRAAFINDLDDPDINPSSSQILENDLVGLSNGNISWSGLPWSEKVDPLNLEIAECALSHNGQVTNCAGEEVIAKMAVPLIMAWWGS